jgi:hypothetical protein
MFIDRAHDDAIGNFTKLDAGVSDERIVLKYLYYVYQNINIHCEESFTTLGL